MRLTEKLTCCRTHSGVCHSDLAIMLNGWKQLPYPTDKGQVRPGPEFSFSIGVLSNRGTDSVRIWQVGGHEGVGIVVKMGPGTETSAVKVGDRVGIKWVAHICGSCRKWTRTPQ